MAKTKNAFFHSDNTVSCLVDGKWVRYPVIAIPVSVRDNLNDHERKVLTRLARG